MVLRVRKEVVVGYVGEIVAYVGSCDAEIVWWCMDWCGGKEGEKKELQQ